MITHDLRVMADAMLDKKAQNVVGIDLRNIGTAITDHFMICNGDSTTNVNAIADNVIEKMRELGRRPLRTMRGGARRERSCSARSTVCRVCACRGLVSS